jgi:hypothetical protein
MFRLIDEPPDAGWRRDAPANRVNQFGRLSELPVRRLATVGRAIVEWLCADGPATLSVGQWGVWQSSELPARASALFGERWTPGDRPMSAEFDSDGVDGAAAWVSLAIASGWDFLGEGASGRSLRVDEEGRAWSEGGEPVPLECLTT